MKVFKFKKVDAKTGISVDIEKPREGPANPNLPGLNVFFDFNNFTYANVDDSAEANPENYIFEIIIIFYQIYNFIFSFIITSFLMAP